MITSITGTGSAISGIGAGSTQRGEGAQKLARPGAAAEDRASISNTVAQMAAEGAPIETDRVSALKAAIRAGTYKSDPQAIATAMIRSDMGTSS
ncbi:flagellar biosynthesis anti-sigma factor FlgM [Sphingomonas oryzagri]